VLRSLSPYPHPKPGLTSTPTPQEDPRDSDKRSKLGGARPSATPRGAGKRNPRLPVQAAGGDALVGARLGVYSVLDDATHRVRAQFGISEHHQATNNPSSQ